jgi:plastocyanin
MAKFFALLGIVVALSFGVIDVSAAAAPPPVALSGKTNVHGEKDVSARSKASLTFEQDDFYFSPTFLKVSPGEKLTITIKNEGKTAHTFTSTALNIDKTVQPDKTTKLKVTIPADGGTIQFHCRIHQGMGMQGAFYTAATTGQATSGATTTTQPDQGVTPEATAPAQTPGTSPPAPTQNATPEPSPPATTPPPPPQPQPTNPPKTQPPATNPGTGGIAF